MNDHFSRLTESWSLTKLRLWTSHVTCDCEQFEIDCARTVSAWQCLGWSGHTYGLETYRPNLLREPCTVDGTAARAQAVDNLVKPGEEEDSREAGVADRPSTRPLTSFEDGREMGDHKFRVRIIP